MGGGGEGLQARTHTARGRGVSAAWARRGRGVDAAHLAHSIQSSGASILVAEGIHDARSSEVARANLPPGIGANAVSLHEPSRAVR